MFDISREEITDGSLTRALVLLAAPLLAQNLTQVAQQVVDVFWVGRLGQDAVAAIGLTFPLVSVLTVVVALTPYVGTQVVVSRLVGAADDADARRVTVHGAALGAVLGVAVAAVGFLAADPLLSLFAADPAVHDLAVTYLRLYVVLLPFAAVSDALEGAFTGWGDSRAALYITLVTVAVNVVLDPVLILGVGPVAGMGIRGAALATVLGYVSGFALALALVFGPRDSYTLTRADVSFDPGTVRELFDVGGPLTAQRLAQDAVRVLVVGVVSATGGVAGLAAYTVGARVATLAFIPATGLQGAAQSVIGQNLGAEQPGRADRATWIGVVTAAGALSLVGVVQLLAPVAITNLFVPDAVGETLALTVSYLQILAYGYWAIGASLLFQAGFNAAGRTRVSLVVTLVQYWLVRLPVALLAAYTLGFGVVGVFWAVTLSNVAAAVGAAAYYVYSSANGLHRDAAAAVAGE